MADSDIDTGSIAGNDAPASEAPKPSVIRSTILDLAHRITDLAEGKHEPVPDVELSHHIAHSANPDIDRLISLRQLLNLVDRIIDRRKRIQDLQQELAQDVAEVEDLSRSISDVDPGLMNQLQGEIAAVKKDRKLYVSDEEDDEEDETEDESTPKGASQSRLIDLPVAERMRLILGPRFVDTERLGQALGHPLDDDQLNEASEKLESVWEQLFERSQLRPHVRANRVRALRKTFKDYALLYRCSMLPGPREDAAAEPCTLEALKQRYPSSFISSSEKTLWYSRLPLYRDPITKPHWCLVDRQYLNCTFKKPGMRLMMYARANELPPGFLKQKSALEDVYDRVILKQVLGQDGFFDNCHSITRTTYHNDGARSKKQVYVYVKGGIIRISGKQGVPHWRPGKARWPGVLVSVVFEAA